MPAACTAGTKVRNVRPPPEPDIPTGTPPHGIQSLLPAIYPILKANYALDFGQIGLLTLAFQVTASLLQPVVGAYTDRRPLPYSLPRGMGATLLGELVDHTSLRFVYQVCSVLRALGLFAAFLPDLRRERAA